MAGSVNLCILIGNLGQDPEIIKGQSGARIAKLSVATSESWRDKNSGERKEVVDWHRITIFPDKLVDFAEKYMKKGNKVYVEGKQKTRKWEKDGVTHYSTEVVIAAFGGRLDNLTRREGSGGPSEDDYGTQSTRSSGESKSDHTPKDDLDDIPF